MQALRNLAAKVAALALVLGIFLGLTEVGLRVYTKFKIFYDVEMTRYAMEVKIPSDNPNIGHEHNPGAKETLMGVPVQINSDGLRDRDYEVTKAAGTRRVAILGDSLTFGWGVASEDSFEYLLENALNKESPTELINFGTGNYNIVQELNLFKKKGLKYDFDDVVLFFFINDAEVTPKQSNWEFLGNFRALTFFWSRIKTVASRFGESRSFKGYYSQLYEDSEPGYQGLQKAFLELNQLCKEKGFGLKVVLLPELHNVDDYPFKKEYGKVSKFLTDSGIENMDLTETFSKEKEPHTLWVSLDDAHPNPKAHKIIADATLAFIRPVKTSTQAVPAQGDTTP